jgi:tetratricopeptide (TPR) repeat protein
VTQAASIDMAGTDRYHSVRLIESHSGAGRARWIESALREAVSPGDRAFSLLCDFDRGGPWAGVRPLFLAIFPEIAERRPDLVERHLVELMYVLPHLRRQYTVKHRNLTDLAPREEKSRFFAADRAYRVLHGLIDLLAEWKAYSEPNYTWIIACEAYDLGGSISCRFFRELHRRLAVTHKITLWLAVEKSSADRIGRAFADHCSIRSMSLDLPAEAPVHTDCALAAQRAAEIETLADGDRIEIQLRLPELIELWLTAGRPDKVLYYRHFALETYNTLGLYEDALRFGDGLLQVAQEHSPADIRLQWSIVVKMLMCYMGLGDGVEGLRLALGPALETAQKGQKVWQGRLSYLIAMFYARYSKPRDYASGVEWLERGLGEIAGAGLPEDEFHFESVFNRNGLAMVRTFQGRHLEAIELCSTGLARLNQHLGAEQHLLHRSILVYNIAQVFVAMGKQAEALNYYSSVIEMDPNYSEYYNERGNIHLSMDHIPEALADYLKAVELSSPYFEVHTNLGQCYRQMGRNEEALRAYSRSLDLEPRHHLALAGRAQVYDALGMVEKAIDDYSAALETMPGQWDIFANRGVLYYQLGNTAAALTDFDRSIELNPTNANLHANRALLFQALNRIDDAIRDIETALSLSQSEEERGELRTSLTGLHEAAKGSNVTSVG